MEVSANKEQPLEELTKDELIIKCKRLLQLAQRVKHAKDECSDELKKCKDNEIKLITENNTLKEILGNGNEKQKNAAELENKIRVAEDKTSRLVERLEAVTNEKNQEVFALQETLSKLNFKISEFEIRSTEDTVKQNDLKLKYDKLLAEKKNVEQTNKELLARLKNKEEKYSLVDKKLVEFQDKYIEEKKQLAKLQNVLEKKLEEKSERSSAESRDSLQPVPENKEVEALCEKMTEAIKKVESLEKMNDELKSCCKDMEKLKVELEQSKNQSNIYENNVKEYENSVSAMSIEITVLKERLCTLQEEKDELANALKNKANVVQEMERLQKEEIKLEKPNLLQGTEVWAGKKEAEDKDNVLKLKIQEFEEKSALISAECEALAAENTRLNEEHGRHCRELEQNSAHVAAEMKDLRDRSTALEIENKNLFKSLEESKNLCESRVAELDNLRVQTVSLEEQISRMKHEAVTCEERYKSQAEEFRKTIASSNEQLSILQAENKRMVESAEEMLKNDLRLSELQSVIASLNEQLDALRLENQFADSKFLEMEKQLQESKQVSESLEAMVNQRCEEYDNFKDKVERYDNIICQLGRVSKDIINTKISYDDLKNSTQLEIVSLQQTYSSIRDNLVQVIRDFAGKLSEGNSELLGEMNEMNQALKERGCTISKLEEEAANYRTLTTELETKLKKALEKFEASQNENQKLRTEIEDKEKFIREMEEEIWRLKSQENPGDALSTSTISKVEESARLVDIEESFEEKYNKLKVLAVRLKKRVIELQNQVEQEKTKLLNERGEFQSKITQFQTQSKSFQTLQAEYDKLQDVFDCEKKQTSDLRKSLDKAREESIAWAKSMEEVKQEREKFKHEKASFDIIKKELTGQIQNLKKMIEKEQSKVKDFDKEREQYEAEIRIREQRLEEESEKHRATLAKLDNQKMEQKKHSLLSLEMADYERTVTELSRRLDSKENQIRELESSLETQRDLSKSLQETVISLESAVAAERQRTDASKFQMKGLQDSLLELKTELNGKVALIAELERSSEEKRLGIEKLSLEVAEISADRAKFEEKCRVAQETFSREMRSLEEKASQQIDLISRKELELSELKKEFDAYKIRAQSVLRQSQKDLPSSRQQDIEDELKLLRSTSDTFRNKLEEACRRSQVLQDENQALMEEKSRLFQKVQELMGVVADLRASNTDLQAAQRTIKEECEESNRVLRLQLETLGQVYKKEMETREIQYNQDIEEVRSALEQAERQLHLHLDTGYKETVGHRRNLSAGKVETPTVEASGHRRQHSANFVPVKTERETLDVLMLEREACEGSESVDSTSPRLVPLDQLLAPPSHSVDISALTDKLDKSDNRIQHLTALLSDAESDAARLQQLNEVLKEEIRRKERNEAREQHANNLEYLKNIVVKFATLPRGDERLRLVPVLNTILKLSPEEENKLSKVARMGAEQAGWGTYLGGMWSGGQ